MKISRCPHCQSVCEVGDCYHDDRLNLRCSQCGQIVLAVTEEDERELLQRLQPRSAKEQHGPAVSNGINMMPGYHPGVSNQPSRHSHASHYQSPDIDSYEHD